MDGKRERSQQERRWVGDEWMGVISESRGERINKQQAPMIEKVKWLL
jgi:hypothetical protein